MMAERKFVFSLLVLALLLFTEACNKKKPVLPPKSLAPTIAVALPNEIPEKPETPVPPVAQAPVEPPPPKTKPKKTTRTTAKTAPVNAPPAPAPAPATNNSSVASLRPPVNPAAGGAAETAIAAALPSAEIVRQKERATQIADATENSLKSLSRPLNDEEKAMKTQIQSYLQQSRKARDDGDFERALNLAQKAQLLADALLKK